ncbi:peroxide stress protein YaaA [Catenisphaera adipataccumulans]|jgi:cytoplasmic iron level regulating protein YaaA (DUF328/UPF0246 family)|uniref:UPF0246 protein HNQ47_001810 n=1 Tax=Catenisphaera adipataccumulans TaxID=700500 RepID=A0A7W8D0J4_9FIRM|nr:peroxide stress protein YaaA [Catenisphaera adipataccumulans]MBB5183769.1 hypothetical protein [Catenisphaera adipataccumulans]
MQIIIAPAKQIKTSEDVLPMSSPIFLQEAKYLAEQIRRLDDGQLKKLLKCSDALVQKTKRQYQNIDAEHSPAIMAYSGIQYQYMAPDVMTDEQLQYLQDHLRILSGLYGILRPFDAIVPYRLEMQAKFEHKNLYAFWGRKLADTLEGPILNLASEEYAKCIRPYKELIDVRFLESTHKEKGVYVKMARGRMVRFLAEEQIETPEDIKKFRELDYRYDPSESSRNQFVFIRNS